MKVNLKNVYYPKPLLSNLTDDYNNNNFQIVIKNQEYDKGKQRLSLTIEIKIDNEYIKKEVNEGNIVPVLHLEQKTQREISVLDLYSETSKVIELYQYSTSEPIEAIGVLYCKNNIKIGASSHLNQIYSLLGNNIEYERGDIIGYSNGIDINLPEDKKIGSIFDLIADKDNTLNGLPLSVSIRSGSELIQILVNNDIHEKFVHIYKKDQYVKKLMFFSIVEPAVISAYTEMFKSYDVYKERKWCRTLANRVEQKLKISADELFIEDNYDVNKVYEYTNYALGELFKDAINTYETGLEDF